MPFLESVENNFLGFNKPASHGHTPKRLSSESLSLRKQTQITDRNYTDSWHMKPLKEMSLTVAEKVMAYLTQRSKMCERKRDMQKHVTWTLLKIFLSKTFLPTHWVKPSGWKALPKYKKCFKVKMYANQSL